MSNVHQVVKATWDLNSRVFTNITWLFQYHLHKHLWLHSKLFITFRKLEKLGNLVSHYVFYNSGAAYRILILTALIHKIPTR